ncbi:hypothetical protein BGZ94_004860 [Podila epigama]|nr:hypothetical protein BGZ94_004860 [Podila epigama]
MSIILEQSDIPSRMTRDFIRHIPEWLWKLMGKKMASARYQVSFLPLIEDPLKTKTRYQPSLHKTLQIHKEIAKKSKAQAKAVASAGAELEP